ncbi:uncharacterized protein EV422DRAFT_537134 [Fimicolochytrium jonesii]|uniref:uncharacterized protein n=1 Tax=Fimicolochytrium jonesii TaxID=1396493 RepID=UPI0022FE2553|nr:uncharacterized protein EV422DRAFT_537134 [Fimicolochytrium jonesii]KAI8818480.1 hypothetical protein EV422DRAFT_537134 [Fimicolochytrium jonesii]
MFSVQARRRVATALFQTRSFTTTTPTAFLRPDYQKVVLLGSVGEDAKRMTFKNGGCIWKFPLVTKERKKDKETGGWKTVNLWHQISFNGEELPKDFEKGAYVIVEGKLHYYKRKGDGPTVAQIKVSQEGLNVTRRADEEFGPSQQEQEDGGEGEHQAEENGNQQEGGEGGQAYGR